MKESVEDNFKFDENGKKFSERVKNTVGKGKIARYQQFFPFPIVFSNNLYCRHVKPRLIWERVNPFPNDKFWTLLN